MVCRINRWLTEWRQKTKEDITMGDKSPKKREKKKKKAEKEKAPAIVTTKVTTERKESGAR
jgi:hypothetical protein